ncbi:MAG TPA: hypothetical protein VLM38_21035 [Blastocatellia bacterium]|nr:hypothetical protein [Blastocatellia bacterium]
MTNRTSPKTPFVTTFLAICLSLATATPGQGFRGSLFKGSQKMETKLTRKHPPLIYITGVAISVRPKSRGTAHAAYAQQLGSELESELCSNDKRLRPEKENPDTIIYYEITQLDCTEKWEIHKSQERRKTGERQKWNEKKKQYETEPVYQDFTVSNNYKLVGGEMNVSYQAIDKRSGAVLDSSNIASRQAKKPYLDGNGAPPQDEVKQGMIKDTVKQIVHRLTPTLEVVPVLLARGKLDNAGKLGQSGLWDKMLEELENKVEPFKDPKDDAYRIYDIGLAYEALAYKAEDLATTRALLQKSVDNYMRALEMNPGEKYFREPQIRIENAVNQYSKFKTQQQGQVGTNRPPSEPRPQSESRQEPRGAKSLPKMPNKPLTNQDVIDLAKKGADEANLIATIKGAAAVRFDLGTEGLSLLLDNKVSNKVIAAMRSRQAPQQKKPRTSRNGQKPIRSTKWPGGF